MLYLKLHGSLGDHVMATGIPEAYFKLYNKPTFVETNFKILFKDNPYVTDDLFNVSKEYSLKFNQYPKDYMIYYPVRIFYDITGVIVDRDFVKPKLYKKRTLLPQKTAIVNDQAGWLTRIGYRYFNDLVIKLRENGFTVWYLRNQKSLNCFGQPSPEVITDYTHKAFDIPLAEVIDRLSESDLYVGYDSGLAQLAGALDVPYVLLAGSVPPINTAHNSCIYALELSCDRCCKEICEKNCLSYSENKNDEIIKIINEKIKRND